MNEADQEYFEWLYSHIGARSARNPAHSHILLAEQLHNHLYFWSIRNDDNRASDGLSLRDEFTDEVGIRPDFFDGNCTMLELMIGIAKRAAYEAEELGIADGVTEWFWLMADHSGLSSFTDDQYLDPTEMAFEKVETILDQIVERSYRPNGRGGFFPLRNPHQDQRETELWLQLSAYIIENSDISC